MKPYKPVALLAELSTLQISIRNEQLNYCLMYVCTASGKWVFLICNN
jgi:hypothetical protein